MLAKPQSARALIRRIPRESWWWLPGLVGGGGGSMATPLGMRSRDLSVLSANWNTMTTQVTLVRKSITGPPPGKTCLYFPEPSGCKGKHELTIHYHSFLNMSNVQNLVD